MPLPHALLGKRNLSLCVISLSAVFVVVKKKCLKLYFFSLKDLLPLALSAVTFSTARDLTVSVCFFNLNFHHHLIFNHLLVSRKYLQCCICTQPWVWQPLSRRQTQLQDECCAALREHSEQKYYVMRNSLCVCVCACARNGAEKRKRSSGGLRELMNAQWSKCVWWVEKGESVCVWEKQRDEKKRLFKWRNGLQVHIIWRASPTSNLFIHSFLFFIKRGCGSDTGACVCVCLCVCVCVCVYE